MVPCMVNRHVFSCNIKVRMICVFKRRTYRIIPCYVYMIPLVIQFNSIPYMLLVTSFTGHCSIFYSKHIHKCFKAFSIAATYSDSVNKCTVCIVRGITCINIRNVFDKIIMYCKFIFYIRISRRCNLV